MKLKSWKSLKKPPPALARPVRDYLADRMRIQAVMYQRAVAEGSLAAGAASTRDLAVLTNKILQELGLWAKLETAERDLMLKPFGSWTESERIDSAVWVERLRMLRWVFRIDKEMDPPVPPPPLDTTICDPLAGPDNFPREIRSRAQVLEERAASAQIWHDAKTIRDRDPDAPVPPALAYRIALGMERFQYLAYIAILMEKGEPQSYGAWLDELSKLGRE